MASVLMWQWEDLAPHPDYAATCPLPWTRWNLQKPLFTTNSEMVIISFSFRILIRAVSLIYVKTLWKPHKHRFVFRVDPLTDTKNKKSTINPTVVYAHYSFILLQPISKQILVQSNRTGSQSGNAEEGMSNWLQKNLSLNLNHLQMHDLRKLSTSQCSKSEWELIT